MYVKFLGGKYTVRPHGSVVGFCPQGSVVLASRFQTKRPQKRTVEFYARHRFFLQKNLVLKGSNIACLYTNDECMYDNIICINIYIYIRIM